MDFTWAVAALSFLSGGAGAYLGSYLKKKGENLATHEDIDKLVDQVGAVTTATKQIETKISGDLWDRQKQWELKRDILFDAAKKLSELDSELLSLQTFYDQVSKGQIQGEESKARLRNEVVSNWRSCMRSFEETQSLIVISCAPNMIRAFGEFGILMGHTATQIVVGDVHEYAATQAERIKKMTEARFRIREELGISLKTPAQSSASS